MQIGVLGAGSWGSALTIAFSQIANVQLWSRNMQQVEQINTLKSNVWYLPDELSFGDNVIASCNLQNVLEESDLIVIATPMSALRSICVQIKNTLIN